MTAFISSPIATEFLVLLPYGKVWSLFANVCKAMNKKVIFFCKNSLGRERYALS